MPYDSNPTTASRVIVRYAFESGRNGPTIKNTMATNEMVKTMHVVRILSIKPRTCFERAFWSEVDNVVGSLLIILNKLVCVRSYGVI